jgi:hypothetical protein
LYTRAAGNSSHAVTKFNNLRKFGFLPWIQLHLFGAHLFCGLRGSH